RRPSGRLLRRLRFLDHAENVAFLHDQEVLAIELDLRARPLAEQDPVAGFDVERDELALLVAAAGAGGDNLAFLRLLLGGVGNDDAASRSFLGFDAAHDDAIMQWAEMHANPPECGTTNGLSPAKR